jgi:hypothetical protein
MNGIGSEPKQSKTRLLKSSKTGRPKKPRIFKCNTQSETKEAALPRHNIHGKKLLRILGQKYDKQANEKVEMNKSQ